MQQCQQRQASKPCRKAHWIYLYISSIILSREMEQKDEVVNISETLGTTVLQVLQTRIKCESVCCKLTLYKSIIGHIYTVYIYCNVLYTHRLGGVLYFWSTEHHMNIIVAISLILYLVYSTWNAMPESRQCWKKYQTLPSQIWSKFIFGALDSFNPKPASSCLFGGDC